MDSKYQTRIADFYSWLTDSVFPLWIAKGIDSTNGGFFESLTNAGEPTKDERRALVQCRQIYSFTEAEAMGIIPANQAQEIVRAGVKFLLQFYLLPNGAFLHAVDCNEKPTRTQSELYTQAFILFSLARAYKLLKDDELKKTAKRLLIFLGTNRKNAAGGYTELKNEKIVFQSNPHMHLFEASIEWLQIDDDPAWKKLAEELFYLAKDKFIDASSGLLAENFSSEWLIQKENGKFLFEPGHQYEWAWLFLQYEKVTGTSAGKIPKNLIDQTEKYGVNINSHLAYDEMLSDFSIKKASSRFWPQCERIKALVEVGLRLSPLQQVKYSLAADEALQALTKYFATAKPGLWQDTRAEDGNFIPQAAKASSLYHIINALSEYRKIRPQLAD